MKITQLNFSLSPSIQKSHNKRNSLFQRPISPNVIHSNQLAPYFKSHQSNKRLKYYSNRNKQQSDIINDKNLQILREEFKKFHDRNGGNLPGGTENGNKEVFNLIVKKYYKKSKISNEFILKKQNNSKQKRLNSKQTQKKIIQNRDKQKEILFEEGNPQLNEGLNLKEELRQKPSNLQGQDKLKRQSIHMRQRSTTIGYSCQVTPKSMQRTVMVPEERLHRHRFNKSSFSQLSHQNPKKQMDNFMVSKNVPSRSVAAHGRSLQSNQSSRSKYTQAKRYVKMKDDSDPSPFQLQDRIDPYTQRQYLHVQLKEQNQKLKTIEKLLNSSIIENNMKKSFLVKTITPQIGILTGEKIQKKNFDIKNDFIRRIRSYNATSKSKSKSKTKNQHGNDKDKNFQLNGWEFAQKIAEDHCVQIV